MKQLTVEFAVAVREAVVYVTQTHGTSGYPELTFTKPPFTFTLRLGQAEDGPCWYCPSLYGMRLMRLVHLEQARCAAKEIT